MAHRGTLFLDEVGDIPLDLQPKLLRALQEKSFERLGGTKTIPIDVRLVAATNRNLTQMMGDKLFRSDLYYRLKVFPITTPPLRDHPEDIPILARHFTKKYARQNGPADRQDPVGHDARAGGLALAGQRAGARKLHRAGGDPFERTNLRAPLAEIREDCIRSRRRRHARASGAGAYHPRAPGKRRGGHYGRQPPRTAPDDTRTP